MSSVCAIPHPDETFLSVFLCQLKGLSSQSGRSCELSEHSNVKAFPICSHPIHFLKPGDPSIRYIPTAPQMFSLRAAATRRPPSALFLPFVLPHPAADVIAIRRINRSELTIEAGRKSARRSRSSELSPATWAQSRVGCN